MEYVLQNSGLIAPCISAAMACNDFLQTSGNLPSSLTMPPFCPPMPSAQVLQAFLLRIAFQSLTTPPTSRALLSVYLMACQPPAAEGFFMGVPSPRIPQLHSSKSRPAA